MISNRNSNFISFQVLRKSEPREGNFVDMHSMYFGMKSRGGVKKSKTWGVAREKNADIEEESDEEKKKGGKKKEDIKQKEEGRSKERRVRKRGKD